MRYTSTRDKSIDVSFEEALTSGYADDGGLFVPQQLPHISKKTLCDWIVNIESYAQLMYNILRMFIDPNEISDDELLLICNESVQGFDDPINCIPVVPFYQPSPSSTLSSSSSTTKRKPSFYVSELFHGPTFCFKDLGMRAVIHLLYTFAKKKQEQTKKQQTITLVVSTTGDTGPAAAQTIYDMNDPIMNIIIHYPYQQISDFQEQQLIYTISSKQIEIVTFDGSGDDMDVPIKNLLALSKKQKHSNHNTHSESSSLWTGVNSYNIVCFLFVILGYAVCVDSSVVTNNQLINPLFLVIVYIFCFPMNKLIYRDDL
jgi:threonine synthase